MSLTSSSTHSLPSYRQKASSGNQDIPFHQQASYITLSRTLTRLSNQLLPLSPSNNNTARRSLTPDQQLRLRDLLSPLPYQRTKTLHTIEHARTLLLQLEQSAHHIKIQRVKRDVVRDLAEKRKAVRKLRGLVEELAREAERREREGVVPLLHDAGDDDDDDDDDYDGQGQGETVEELLGLPPLAEENRQEKYTTSKGSDAGIDGNTLTITAQGGERAGSAAKPSASSSYPSSTSNNQPNMSAEQQKDELFFNLRQRRRTPITNPSPSFPTTATATATATATGSSIDPDAEKTLLHTDRLAQSSLTDSLLTLARQLKAQSESLNTTLHTTDKSYLDRALAGLDSNVSGLESASRKMGLLKRMSEGQGWWGRIMLYLWIWALWALALLLVFVGPKFRF
ncbi:hypothetical protein GJ744_003549 [Endocarpon pusillum]|uniref:Synaptobrevin n=1 Tax=Endocarpon pusillum TaxID=364733 RepID=A0A8H7AMI6_9EURO|nr:hypothetical protein GJ744_003549 [Endocarpon pusillum]